MDYYLLAQLQKTLAAQPVTYARLNQGGDRRSNKEKRSGREIPVLRRRLDAVVKEEGKLFE